MKRRYLLPLVLTLILLIVAAWVTADAYRHRPHFIPSDQGIK